MNMRWLWAGIGWALLGEGRTLWGAEPSTEPIPVAALARSEPVDFAREVRPILERSCLACHSAAKSESELNLESPESIRKGGASGSAMTPGNGAESLLVAVASRTSEPHMPPPDNPVGAVSLSSDELGLLKLWIDQGATGDAAAPAAPVAWQPLPAGVQPVLATALSPDGQFVACSRANQIFVYHLPSGRLVSRLGDPELVGSGVYDRPGVAHLDLVQSLAFSPDGYTLASGGYREVKLWTRPRHRATGRWTLGEPAPQVAALSGDAHRAVTASADGQVRFWSLSIDAGPRQIAAARAAGVTALGFASDGDLVAAAGNDQTLRFFRATDGALLRVVRLPSAARALDFRPGSQELAVGLVDQCWLVSLRGEPRMLGGPELAATALAWLPDGQQLALGGADGAVRIWQVEPASEARRLEAGGPVTALAIRPDGARLAAGTAAGLVRAWNLTDGAVLGEVAGDALLAQTWSTREALRAIAEARTNGAAAALAAAQAERDAKTQAVPAAEAELATAAPAAEQATAAVPPVAQAKAAAEARLAELTQAQATAQQTQQQAEAQVAGLAAAVNALGPAAVAARSAVDALSQAVTAATAALEAARAALAAQPQDSALMAAVAAAEQAAGGAQGALAQAQQTSAAAEGQLSAQQAALAAAQAALPGLVQATADAAAALAQATEAKTAADKALADAEAAAKAAADKRTAAERTLATATNARAVAEELLARATQFHTGESQSLTARSAERDAAQAQLEAARKAIRRLSFTSAGELFVADEAGRAERLDGERLAGIESWRAEGGAVLATASGTAGEFLTLTAPGTLERFTIADEWTLAKRLGPASSRPGDPLESPLVDRVLALAFSPDGTLLATGGGEPSRSGELKLWNVAEGTLARDWPEAHSDTVFALDFSADGRHLASAAADKFVKVWSTSDGGRLRAFEGHTHHVLGVRWKFDGALLASCGADKVIKLWNFDTGEQQRTIAGFGKEVTGIWFVGRSNETLTAAGDAAVRRHNADDGKTLKSFAGGAFLYSLAATPDGRLLAAGGDDGALRVWNAASGELVAQFDKPAADEQVTSAAP